MNGNQGKKINTYSEVDSLLDDSTFVVLQKINGVRKVRQFTKEKFVEQFLGSFVNPIVVTYAQLLALKASNSLLVNRWYKITNATGSPQTLLVQAVSASEIGCDAKDPLYPNDKVMYNFASDVITWRWDTVNDISAGEDWRNSNNIQIGTGCSKISIGSNCDITIGNNCSNISIGNGVIGTIGNTVTYVKVGNNVVALSIIATSNNIEIGDNCTFNSLGVGTNIYLFGGSSFSIPTGKTANGITLYSSTLSDVSDDLQNLTAYNASVDVSTATTIYNEASASKSIIMNASNLARLNYINGSNVMVNVDAEA